MRFNAVGLVIEFIESLGLKEKLERFLQPFVGAGSKLLIVCDKP